MNKIVIKADQVEYFRRGDYIVLRFSQDVPCAPKKAGGKVGTEREIISTVMLKNKLALDFMHELIEKLEGTAEKQDTLE